MKTESFVLACLLLLPAAGGAEVVKVSVARQAIVANGQPFGSVGAYEKLTGTIEFAVDPSDPHNAVVADLEHAARAADGKVHFTSDLYVLRPADPAKANGVLLFEIANRGNKGLLTRFNGAPASADPDTLADFGNGFLMREGYTLVWVGWEFDLASGVRVAAPAAARITDRVAVRFIPNERTSEAALTDAPMYPPANADDAASTLTVRSRFWDAAAAIARDQWTFLPGSGTPRLSLKSGFEPGRIYEVTYRASGAVVSGVGLAATRDAASAFRYRTDLPVQGRSVYIFGASQSGRFLRQFLNDGFNADERGRRAFDAVWPHIAGAALGSFNERFATPTSLTAFLATREPFLTEGLLTRYQPPQRPKVILTNTSVEYWGGGRAAALTHTTPDGRADAPVPDDVRIYLLAGTQHGEAAFPPAPVANGQQLPNPVPQREVMRALLTGLHRWVTAGAAPPDSRYPRLSDGTLTPVGAVRFPMLGTRDPRTIPGPGITATGPLPFLVPQVDADGNEIAGIRVPEQRVPLATTTGWNFRSERVGNPEDIFALLGSYVPLTKTRVERQARSDPRPSVQERYAGKEDYLAKIRAAAEALIRDRYLLREDLPTVLDRANRHWDYATRAASTSALNQTIAVDSRR
jgi:hypothetical protein